ncbi:MAG: DUF4249 domain-containing protein [Muribaculum sp.]|nr:DUF4249 domain-containing protein [Muribaculum sp.]
MGILKHTIYSVLTVVILTGCLRDFTDEIDTTPVLCINSLISAGEPIEVSVSHTWKYTDVEIVIDPDHYYGGGYEIRYDKEVSDAIVEIYVNGRLESNDYIPKEGDHIRIVATSRKYGSAEGEVTVPVSVPIESLEWDASISSQGKIEDEYGRFKYSVKFRLDAKLTLEDAADGENYYQVTFNPRHDDMEGDDSTSSNSIDGVNFSMGEFKYQSEPVFSEHIGMIDAISGMDAYGFTFFTDRQFSGEKYTLNLQFENMEIKTVDVKPDESDMDWSVCFDLYTTSQSLYNLANYRWHCYEGLVSDIGNIGMSDPVWGYSNVSTGAGVIAAQSKSTCKINLKDFFLSQMEQ